MRHNYTLNLFLFIIPWKWCTYIKCLGIESNNVKSTKNKLNEKRIRVIRVTSNEMQIKMKNVQLKFLLKHIRFGIWFWNFVTHTHEKKKIKCNINWDLVCVCRESFSFSLHRQPLPGEDALTRKKITFSFRHILYVQQ